MASSGTIKFCLPSGPREEQRSNVMRGKVIQKPAQCVTSLHCAALCCCNQHTVPLPARFAYLFYFIEPFWTVVIVAGQSCLTNSSHIASWTGGFRFEPQHLLSFAKCSVVFPPEALCDCSLKLATIYSFIFPLHDSHLRYRTEDTYKILLRQSDF
jgi:hypothetical protein